VPARASEPAADWDIDMIGSPADTRPVYADVTFSPSPALWVVLAIIVLGALAAWLWVRRSRKARGPSARRAVFSLLGDVTEGALPFGWTDEQIVVLIGDVRLDLRTRPPGDRAILRVFHLAGDVQLRVSPGTRVTTSGTTVLGDQRVDVEAGEGPEIEVRAWGLFGDVKVASNGGA
jgi:predicted membrane protein